MKSSKIIFACQINEGYLKVMRCLRRVKKTRFLSLDTEGILNTDDDRKISEKLTRIFKNIIIRITRLSYLYQGTWRPADI